MSIFGEAEINELVDVAAFCDAAFGAVMFGAVVDGVFRGEAAGGNCVVVSGIDEAGVTAVDVADGIATFGDAPGTVVVTAAGDTDNVDDSTVDCAPTGTAPYLSAKFDVFCVDVLGVTGVPVDVAGDCGEVVEVLGAFVDDDATVVDDVGAFTKVLGTFEDEDGTVVGGVAGWPGRGVFVWPVLVVPPVLFDVPGVPVGAPGVLPRVLVRPPEALLMPPLPRSPPLPVSPLPPPTSTPPRPTPPTPLPESRPSEIAPALSPLPPRSSPPAVPGSSAYGGAGL